MRSIAELIVAGVIGTGVLVGFKSYPTEVKQDYSRADIEHYIETVGVEQCGIDASIWHALIQQESGYNNKAYKFEAHVVPRVKGMTKDPRDIPMLASSHGALQIMGYHAVKAGYKWQDLYDLDVAFGVGCKLLKDCYSRAKGAGKAKLSSMFACWNGNAQYGTKVTQQVERTIFDNMRIANNPHNEKLDTRGLGDKLASLW